MDETKSVILVVDDQPDIIEGIKLILEQEEFEVWTAANGQLALNRLEEAFNQPRLPSGDDLPTKYLPDLILADIMMPVMDGYELYERVRSNPYLNHIPFTFLSAKVDAVDVRQGKALGVDDYLTKPCLPEDLIASVKGKLRRTEQRRSIQSQFISEINHIPTAGIIMLIAFVGLIILIIVVTVYLTLNLAG